MSDKLNNSSPDCSSVTKLLHQLLNQTHHHDSPVESTISQEDRDRHAILYIVVVLLFYSVGIVIAIIMYLKREKNEAEEEKAFDDYMNFRQDPDMQMRYHRVQAMVGQLNNVEMKKTKRTSTMENLKLYFSGNKAHQDTPGSSLAIHKTSMRSCYSLEQKGKNELAPVIIVERSVSWCEGQRETKDEDELSLEQDKGM